MSMTQEQMVRMAVRGLTDQKAPPMTQDELADFIEGLGEMLGGGLVAQGKRAGAAIRNGTRQVVKFEAAMNAHFASVDAERQMRLAKQAERHAK